MQRILRILIYLYSFRATLVSASWRLQHAYQGQTFFDGFTFFTDPDPTHGFVRYVNRSAAEASGLIHASRDAAVLIQADHTSIAHDGRPSVRLTSNEVYQSGLFLFDVEHMPIGCGTWPALWLVGPDWPSRGEIDVVEGVNTQTANRMTLHTTNGCHMDNDNEDFTGKMLATNCYVKAANQTVNEGCSVQDESKESFGARFNRDGGGVFALHWAQGIRIWFFPRHQIPKDIRRGTPDPSRWSEASAVFPFGPKTCSAHFFSDMRIVINLTFCGDWAGAQYKSMGCPGDCVSHVMKHPEQFSEAYWSIQSIKVYMQ